MEGNGFLDEFESKVFLEEIQLVMIDKTKSKNYDEDNFKELYDSVDDDANGYLTKGEMAQFIKMAFKEKK